MNRQKFIPYNQKLKPLARKMRNNSTAAEKIFWYEILRNKNFWGFNFLRQKPLLNYIVDFYCSDLLLAIELDGATHLESEKYDQQRESDLKKYGVKIIRYFNDAIFGSLDGISEDLEEKIKDRIKELGVELPVNPLK